ncbi:MAG: threonine--tRNA ligase, partial [Candidatus Omnitrophica bacterium]|nr:threonine--tRNA ligase [Candidatus Omnitrophota bacterium]
FYHPKGALMRKILEDFTKELHLKRGYDLVMTPNFLRGKLWEISGHAEHYRENMYYFKIDGEEYAVKPMNCPGHMLIYGNRVHSYREFPIKYFELGTVYRYEKAGVLHGLLRVRGFTQDDAHIFCRREQVKEEVVKVIDFVFDLLADFGFKEWRIELSTRPEKFIGRSEDWDIATQALKDSLAAKNNAYEINEGAGAFYGPKIDIKLRDAIGREWQCATIQCDLNLTERFDIAYIDENGQALRPIMLHRAILGSVERFIGTLIEHYGGAFPVWLAPTQIALIPIREEHQAYAEELKTKLAGWGLRVIIDGRNESLNKRVRENTVKKIPYVLVLGDKEAQSKTVAVRAYGTGDQGAMDFEVFREKVLGEVKSKKIGAV